MSLAVRTRLRALRTARLAFLMLPGRALPAGPPQGAPRPAEAPAGPGQPRPRGGAGSADRELLAVGGAHREVAGLIGHVAAGPVAPLLQAVAGGERRVGAALDDRDLAERPVEDALEHHPDAVRRRPLDARRSRARALARSDDDDHVGAAASRPLGGPGRGDLERLRLAGHRRREAQRDPRGRRRTRGRGQQRDNRCGDDQRLHRPKPLTTGEVLARKMGQTPRDAWPPRIAGPRRRRRWRMRRSRRNPTGGDDYPQGSPQQRQAGSFPRARARSVGLRLDRWARVGSKSPPRLRRRGGRIVHSQLRHLRERGHGCPRRLARGAAAVPALIAARAHAQSRSAERVPRRGARDV